MLGRTDVNLGEYLGSGGAAAVVVNGVGNADVQSNGEGSGLDVAEGLVQELKMTLEQVLTAVSHSLRER